MIVNLSKMKLVKYCKEYENEMLLFINAFFAFHTRLIDEKIVDSANEECQEMLSEWSSFDNFDVISTAEDAKSLI